MKIYGRERSAQSSSHTDSQMSGKNGVSQYAKTASRLVKRVPVFLIAFTLSEGENCPQRKEFQDAEDIKKNVTAEMNGLTLEDIAEFSKPVTHVFK
jgi:hypothetical protein